jgi:addiction module RelE/StbE family toxin
MADVKVEFSKRFLKALRKAPRKIQIAYRDRLEIFLADRYHPLLNNHSLLGKLTQYRSINISGDWRAIFRELEDGNLVFFDFLGTHSQLYK